MIDITAISARNIRKKKAIEMIEAMPCYEVRKTVKDTGYPVHTKSGAISEKWRKAHPAANKAALEKFGSRKAKAIVRLVQQLPEGELLGKHTKAGKIIISGKVPPSLRSAIRFHEKVEHERMGGKK